MAEQEIDLRELLAEDEEAPQQDTYPVPGGYVDLVPVAATLATEYGAIKVKAGGAWGYCPFGIFFTEGETADGTIDGLLPFKQITGIQFHYDEYVEWAKSQERDENSSD